MEGDSISTIDRLRTAPVELLGRIADSSNATFLVAIEGAGELRAIYKPLAGERPLWDFPEGLYRREVAAYELGSALGWPIVPPTVVRDGEFGVGSMQQFIEADFARHYFDFIDDETLHDQLRRIALFDLLTANTDRKGGHVLIDDQGQLWAIDNGLCFSTEARLRTVIWDFAGQSIPAELMDPVCELLDSGLPESLEAYLTEPELERVLHRARLIRSAGQFPHDPTGRAVPWPLV